MAIGLYIHVPFCLKKCNYCDFISYSYDAGLAASYVYALKKEIEMYGSKFSAEEKEIASIYMGGGTPSLLSEKELEVIFRTIDDNFNWPKNIEVTLEVNPGTVNKEKLVALRNLGSNRLSVGIQSFQDNLLKKMGRIHTAQTAYNTLSAAKEAGFLNISFDLIFGIPNQSISNWKDDIKKSIELNPSHISAYSLKIEQGTPFAEMLLKGAIKQCDEEIELEMFLYAIDELTSHGYDHYEISNFCKPGKESIHNIRYWTDKEYIGVGPAAHSYFHRYRSFNHNELENYFDSLQQGKLPIAGNEYIDKSMQISEYIFLGLRMIKGISLVDFEKKFGQSLQELFPRVLDKLLQLEVITINEGFLRLTRKGLPLANEVFAEFI